MAKIRIEYGTARCLHCGKEFERKPGNQVFCSKECQAGAQRATRDKVNAKIYEGGEWIECAWCGQWFNRPYKSRRQYCSEDCADMAKEDLVQNREYGRGRRKHVHASRNPESQKKRDGFTWDDIRGVLAEYKISSYSKAVAILEERREKAKSE